MIEDRFEIRKMPEYEDYHSCEKKIMHVPGLKMRVDELRQDLFSLNREKPAEGFLAATGKLWEKYDDILRQPAVREYLEAEARLEKRLRECIGMSVLAADMYYPGKTEDGREE